MHPPPASLALATVNEISQVMRPESPLDQSGQTHYPKRLRPAQFGGIWPE